MKPRSMRCHLTANAARLALMVVLVMGPGSPTSAVAQNAEHTGTKLEGYATVVTPNSITVFDKKNREFKILTDQDYSARVGIGAAVTVWYTTTGGAYHLEDIVYPTSGGTFVSTDLIRQNTHRVVILPKPEDVDNTKGLMDAIATYLADNARWFVAPSELAEEIAARSKIPSSTLDAVNPDTGDVDMQRYLQSRGSLVARIANETHSDAVLEVRVIKVKANVRSSVATWDNMTEPLPGHKSHALPPFGGGGKGWVYAATADMSLWSRTGELLWKKRRGFAVLGVQSGGAKFRERPLTEVYPNSNFMERWLVDTLGELAPHRGIPAAAPAMSPALQKELEKARQAGEGQK